MIEVVKARSPTGIVHVIVNYDSSFLVAREHTILSVKTLQLLTNDTISL
jgi:hypothetical protein